MIEKSVLLLACIGIGCATTTPYKLLGTTGSPQDNKEMISRLMLNVEGDSRCVDAEAIEQRLLQTLARVGASDAKLQIAVQAIPVAENTFSVTLTITREQKLGLKRDHTLSKADCQSLDELLAVAVERFFTAFPRWKLPEPPPSPPAQAVKWAEIELCTTLSSEWSPFGGELAFGARVDFGKDHHRFGTSVVFRESYPPAVGSGHFLQTTGLVGAFWRYARSGWQPRVEIRGGAMLVNGYGYEQNLNSWLPWLDAAIAIEKRWSGVVLGLELAASPMRHVAVTRDRLNVRDISWIKVGFLVSFPIWNGKNEGKRPIRKLIR